MKATILLLPEGTKYQKTFTEASSEYVPLTFAFPYPEGGAEGDDITSARLSALVEAVATTFHEYQHVLVATNDVHPPGANETDRTINEESISMCWKESAALALMSGTHSTVSWGLTEPAAKPAREKTELRRKFEDAYLWGREAEIKSMLAYLTGTTVGSVQVAGNDPTAMNKVLSLCRAMTQQPRDLTAAPYPSADVQFTPFFPSTEQEQTK